MGSYHDVLHVSTFVALYIYDLTVLPWRSKKLQFYGKKKTLVVLHMHFGSFHVNEKNVV